MEERMQQRLGDGDDVFKIVRCTTESPSNNFNRDRWRRENTRIC